MFLIAPLLAETALSPSIGRYVRVVIIKGMPLDARNFSRVHSRRSCFAPKNVFARCHRTEMPRIDACGLIALVIEL